MIARVFLLASLLAAAPAQAAQSVELPEGSSLTLFALGVLGVIIGRRVSAGKRD